MTLLTLQAAADHVRCGIDDPSLPVYVNAATLAVVSYLNRTVYEDATALAAANDPDGIVVDDAIRAAILLITGHLYANRETVVAGVTVATVPISAHYLLDPYRINLGV